MLTFVGKIKECSDIEFLKQKQKNYSFAFHKLYKNFVKASTKTPDLEFIFYLKNEFGLNEIEYRALYNDVETKKKQMTTINGNKVVKIKKLNQEVIKLTKTGKKKPSAKNTRSLFRITKKIKHLEDSLKREITFGGKETQRELTKLYNNIEVITKETDVIKRNKILVENQQKIDEQTQLWIGKRTMHFYLLGEANQGGNRFAIFDFVKKTITYKPYCGKKIVITYSCSGNQQKQLEKLQELVNAGKIAISLKISTKQVCISFDDEKLSEFYLEETTKRKELSKIKKMDIPDEEKRKLRYAVKAENEEKAKAKKLTEKIKNRYMSVDLNPEYIGFCIADKGLNGIKKIIHEGVVDLTELNKKLGLSSDNPKVIKQNSKRRNEICNVWKKIFDIATRFRVAHFVKENLSNLGANEKFDSKSGNQKVRNFWHRTLTEHQITKRCTKYGIELIEVDPAYSSFIGNMLYNNFDATNAAIEICRRGMFKFSEGLSYPPVPGTIFDTMVRLADYRKVVVSQLVAQKLQASKDWKELYGIVNNVLRWRWDWDGVSKLHSVFSLGSDKSKVKFIQFVG